MWVGVCVWNNSQFSNLQAELKYLNSFKFHDVFTDLGGSPWGWVGWVGVDMGVEYFTVFKSSNRIIISQFIQVLISFN